MFILFILMCAVLGVVIGIPLGIRKYTSAEKTVCPTCGETFKLIGGSAKCTKCKTRITRTSDGRLITH